VGNELKLLAINLISVLSIITYGLQNDSNFNIYSLDLCIAANSQRRKRKLTNELDDDLNDCG
jgi:hypothetical protein